MEYRFATQADCTLLAEWNWQLIQDEGHRNPMTVAELRVRMENWLKSEYRAVIFSTEQALPFAYALYRNEPDHIYLRQFFVARDYRGRGMGKMAMQKLLSEVWPNQTRIRVEVLTRNAGALSFWRKIGFCDYSLCLEAET